MTIREPRLGGSVSRAEVDGSDGGDSHAAAATHGRHIHRVRGGYCRNI